MKRRIAAILFATLLTTAFSSLVRAEEASAIDAAIEKYIMEHPDVILKSIREFQNRDKITPAQAEKLKNDDTSPFVGNKDADVTLIEFFDYHCGYCKRFYPSIAQLVEEDKNLKVVFKELPIISPDSEIATKASLAMYSIAPDKYFGFHSALMKVNTRFEVENMISLAKQAGVDEATFTAAMNSEKIEQEIENTKKLAEDLGISGTPVVIIGKQLLPGAVDIQMLRSRIAHARENNGKK